MQRFKYTLSEGAKESIRNITLVMDLRTEQIKEAYPENWWSVLIEDDLYKFLCKQLVEVRAVSTNVRAEIDPEDIKKLASNLINPEQFIELLDTELK